MQPFKNWKKIKALDNQRTLISINGSYVDRKIIIESVKYVDFVFEESSWDQKIQDIIKYDIDKFVMGNDWLGKFDFLNDYCEVIYLTRTEIVSSSDARCFLNGI
jgi:glycerol-3-phosphate cytidylyltransferase